MSTKLDITSFQNALKEFEKPYRQALTPAVKTDAELFAVCRTAVVKGCKYTYGLAIKSIERFIATYSSKPVAMEDLNFRDMLRLAIDSRWTYRNNRNATSHGYQQAIADRIFAAAPALIEEARFTLAALQTRLKGEP